MTDTYDRDPAFDLEGRFLGFVMKNNKIQFLRIAVAEEELHIKLPKELQTAIFRAILQAIVRTIF